MSALSHITASKTKGLHSGKWTQEESEYVKELIKEFEAGSLNIEENISLRSFLSKALNCSPKRISKKFECTSYNGKQLYKRKTSGLTPEEVKVRREKLRELERKYQESLQVLQLVEASRKPSSVQGQTNIADINEPVLNLIGATMVGEPSLTTAHRLALADIAQQARIAQLKAQINMAAMTFNPSSSPAVALGRCGLGPPRGSGQMLILPLPTLPKELSSPPQTRQLDEELVLGQIIRGGSLPSGIASTRGYADPLQQLKRELAFTQTGDLPALKRFRLN